MTQSQRHIQRPHQELIDQTPDEVYFRRPV